MPENLRQIGFTLKEISKSAEDASKSIERLKAELKELMQVSGAVKGGTPTEAGIERLAMKMLSGAELPLRPRVGGGAYLSSAAAIREELKRLQESAIKASAAVASTPLEGISGFSRLKSGVETVNDVLEDQLEMLNIEKELMDRMPESVIRNLGRRGRREEPPISEQELRRLLGGDVAVTEDVIRKAQSYGMSLNNLKKASTEASTGLTRLNFVSKESGRIFREVNIFVDKFGNVIVDTQKRFRGFVEAIGRNFSEVIKWSIAATSVYSVIRKLNELVEIAIKNESVLADIGIVLGQSHYELGEVFDRAARAANSLGESIDGVLKGYVQAYRATGSIENQFERATVTQKLLIDSLMLSKLASIDQAKAMDTLIGALRQTGMELDEGSKLLDKWVAVSRNANVSLDTFAESFAITAAAAETAGLSVDELNGLVAVLAQATSLSATETGNAIRALVGGFQTDMARRELSSFGIAVEDVNGKLRPLQEVLTDISAAFQAGIISETELQRIATALAGGGGQRRGPQIVAILKDLGKVNELAKISVEAHGDAEEALAIKLETAQTAITRLGNEFQKLAQILGVEGGVLGAFKVFVGIVDTLVQSLQVLTKSLGGMTPYLAIIMALSGYARFTNRTPFISQRVGILAQEVSGRALGAVGVVNADAIAMSIGKGVSKYAPMIGVAIGEAFWAINNIYSKDWIGLSGQALGGVVGYSLAKGPWGIMLGSAIGEALANSLLKHGDDITRLFEPFERKTKEAVKAAGETEEEKTLKELYKAAGFGVEMVGSLMAKVAALMTQMASAAGTTRYSLNEYQAALALARLGLRQQEFDELLRRITELGGEGAVGGITITTPFTEATAIELERNADIITRVITDTQNKLKTQYMEGAISTKEYRDALDRLSSNKLIIDSFVALNGALGDTETTFKVLTNTISHASEVQKEEIATLITEISNLVNKIEEYKKAGDSAAAGDFQRSLEENRRLLASQIEIMERQLSQRFIKLTPIVKMDEDMTREQLDSVLREAFRLQEQYLKALAEQQKLSPEELEALKASWEPFFIYLKEGYISVSGLQQQFLTQAAATAAAQPLGLQIFRDITMGQFMQAQAMSEQLIAAMQAAFPEWKPDRDSFIGIFKDGVTGPITGDLGIIQLLLQDLIDVNEKQLDGIYNLPANASFYVPFTGYRMGFVNQGTGAAGIGTSWLNTLLESLKKIAEERKKIETGAAVSKEYISGMAEAYRRRIVEREKAALDIERESYSEMYRKFREEEQMYYPKRIKRTKTREELLPDEIDINKVPFLLRPFFFENKIQPSFGGRELIEGIIGGLNQLSEKLKMFLNIEINDTISLIVDGRTLATVVKPYLLADLVRYEGGGGSSTKKFVL